MCCSVMCIHLQCLTFAVPKEFKKFLGTDLKILDVIGFHKMKALRVKDCAIGLHKTHSVLIPTVIFYKCWGPKAKDVSTPCPYFEFRGQNRMRRPSAVPLFLIWEIIGTLSAILFSNIGTKFDGCGTKFHELGTKYNPEVIKYVPL